VVMALRMTGFLWLQVMSQVVMTTAAAVYFVHFKPMEDQLSYRLEILNEITGMLALSLTFCFSDLVPDSNKYTVGVFFNCLMLGNILVHMRFIMESIVLSARKYCNRKKIKQSSQESMSISVLKFKEERKKRREQVSQLVLSQVGDPGEEFEKWRKATQEVRVRRRAERNASLLQKEEENKEEESKELDAIPEEVSDLEASQVNVNDNEGIDFD